ncbi:hypothetical protein AURDEDRAFT_171476 [Auricularia subglabra TFB-10046 SS5]|nr:hypothetical protein AURDEDRAFT_171476 [Auricularia subglabra TFB-10046 SS5]
MPPRKRALSQPSPADSATPPIGKKARILAVSRPPAQKRTKPPPPAPTRHSTRLHGKVQPTPAEETAESSEPQSPARNPVPSTLSSAPASAGHDTPVVPQPSPNQEDHGGLQEILAPSDSHPDETAPPRARATPDADAPIDTTQIHRIANKNADARVIALHDQLDADTLNLLNSAANQSLESPPVPAQGANVQDLEPPVPQEQELPDLNVVPPVTNTTPVNGNATAVPANGPGNPVTDVPTKRRTKPAKLQKGVRIAIPYSLLYKFKEDAQRKDAVLVEAPVFRTTTPLQTKSAKGISDHMGDIWLHATEGMQKTLDLAPGFGMVFYRPLSGSHANVRAFWSPSIQEHFPASGATFTATEYTADSSAPPAKVTVNVPQAVDEIVRQFCILTDPLVDKPSTQQADTIRTLATKNDELEREKAEAIRRQREVEERNAALERELAALRGEI